MRPSEARESFGDNPHSLAIAYRMHDAKTNTRRFDFEPIDL